MELVSLLSLMLVICRKFGVLVFVRSVMLLIRRCILFSLLRDSLCVFLILILLCGLSSLRCFCMIVIGVCSLWLMLLRRCCCVLNEILSWLSIVLKVVVSIEMLLFLVMGMCLESVFCEVDDVVFCNSWIGCNS